MKYGKKRMKRIVMIKLCMAMLLVSACSDFNNKVGLKDDNKAEQFVEEEIQEKTGIIIDFTPQEKAPETKT